MTRAQLAEAARLSAADLELTPNGRLLWSEPDFSPSGWVSALVAPLAVDGSVVLVRNPDPARMPDRIASERVTVAR
jgi:hypothetical protein